jgi:Tfp pilus assembly protein PilV
MLQTTNYKLQTRFGFSVVEAILSVALFSLFITGLVGAYLYGEEATMLAGNRSRAVMFSEEALEAVRNIRDADFTNLTDGAYGLATTSNIWNLAGASDTNGIFTRHVDIASVDANRKSVTASALWQQNPARGGSVAITTYLTNWRRAVSARLGMLVYGNGGTATDEIRYKTFDPNAGTWSASSTLADINTGSSNRYLRAIRIYASATRNEKIAISRHYNGTTQYIYAQVFDGASWGNVQLLSNWNAQTFLDVQNFDGDYLNDGTFLAIFSDNTAIPKRRIWNGTSWSAQASLRTLGSGQIPNYIIAKARPGTNEAMTAFFTQGSDAKTQYFNGTAWSAVTTHATAAPVNTKRLVDFDWNPNSPLIGGLAYSTGANDRRLHIKIWTANGAGGGAWSAVANTGNQGVTSTRVGARSIVGRPGANEFIVCNVNTVPQIRCYESNFTPAWTTPANGIISAATDPGVQRTFHAGLETLSGNPAIAVYSDNTIVPKLKKYNSVANSWDAAATNVTTAPLPVGTIKTVRMISDLSDDDIMIFITDANMDIYSIIWDGTTNALYSAPAGKAFMEHGILGSATTDYWYDFAWDRY